MNQSYLNVTEGKNGFWRYFFTVLAAFLVLPLGVIAEVLYVQFDGNDSTYIEAETAIGISPAITNLLAHIPFVIGLFVIWLAVRFILKRPLRSLVTKNEKIDWRKIGWSFTLFSLLFLIGTLLLYLMQPEAFSFYGVRPSEYLLIFFTTLLLTPFQIAYVELLFRGLVLQWISKAVKNPIVLSLLLGVILLVLQFLPSETAALSVWLFLEYFLMMVFLTYLAIKTGSLELSIGVIAANTMWMYWLISVADVSENPLPSLFILKGASPFSTFMITLVSLAVFYIFTRKKYNWRGAS